MQLLIPIPIVLIILIVLIIKNQNKSYPSVLKVINRTTYGIWFISLVFMMINTGDVDSMQFRAAIGFAFVTTLAIVILIVTNAIRLKV